MKEMRIGRMTLQIRSNSSDPLTETARLIDRFPITTDEQWVSWKSQGHCGKPASAYSLYCDNHEPMHHNDDPMTPVSQAIDNRLGGRQRVVMGAHIKAPKPSNIVTPTAPATHTPTMNAITNARTEKEITMSTTNNTPASVNLDAITAQIAALNAALAARMIRVSGDLPKSCPKAFLGVDFCDCVKQLTCGNRFREENGCHEVTADRLFILAALVVPGGIVLLAPMAIRAYRSWRRLP